MADEEDFLIVVGQPIPFTFVAVALFSPPRSTIFSVKNAIVFAKDRRLTGMGAGQPNRVGSVFLACRVAQTEAQGSVMASDAFFPFPDGVEQAAEQGITAVAQPGGSVRDGDVIAAADRLGLSMVLTGVRHFLH